MSTFTTFSAGAFIDRNPQVNVGYIMPDYSSLRILLIWKLINEANAKVFLGKVFTSSQVFSLKTSLRDVTFDGVVTGDVESSTLALKFTSVISGCGIKDFLLM